MDELNDLQHAVDGDVGIALLVVFLVVGVFVFLKWPVLRERLRAWRQRNGKA